MLAQATQTTSPTKGLENENTEAVRVCGSRKDRGSPSDLVAPAQPQH